MDQNTSIDDILNDEPNEAPEAVEAASPVEAAPVAEKAEKPEPPRDDSGRFATKGDDSGVPPQADEPKLDHAAIIGERRRRQEAEQRAAALEAQIQALQNPPLPPPSLWEDEDAARQYDRDQAVAAAVQQATFNSRLDMSEMMVRQANPDFETVKAEFLALAEQHPELRQQALQDPHPWNKAYQIAKNHKTMQDLGSLNIDDLKAKMREELMAEMQGQVPARPGLPPSLSNERNVGSRSGPAWSGPKPLSELLG